MNSIYLILVAIYLFHIATNLSENLEKVNFYRGLLFIASLMIFVVSFVLSIYTK